MNDAEPTVRHNAERQRYEILVDGDVAGFAEHQPFADGVEAFPHTVVQPEHEGKGLAATLVRAALDDVRARGVLVVPSCWYVARWIERHPEYRDLIADPAG